MIVLKVTCPCGTQSNVLADVGCDTSVCKGCGSVITSNAKGITFATPVKENS